MKKKVKETGILLSEDTAELAYHVEVRKSFWAKFRYGAAATVFTLVFVALMIGLNLLVGLASERFHLQVELTEDQVFTVSEKTEAFLQDLEHDVELIVLGDEATWRSYSSSAASGGEYQYGLSVSREKYLVETLDRYAQLSDRVKLYYVNPDYHPDFFAERNHLPITDHLQGADGKEDTPVLIVYSPDTGRYRYVRKSVFSDSQYLPLENRLNGGIRYATNPDMQKVALISGHGEYQLSYFEDFMEGNGFDVEILDLPQAESIPSDYQMIVICNPGRQYSLTDIEKIEAFLSNGELQGKSMMVFADMDYCKSDKYLREYLEEWGIGLGDQSIYDSNRLTLKNVTTIEVNYAEEAASMSGTLVSGDYKLKLELGKIRVLKDLWNGETRNNIGVYTLLESSRTSFARYQVTSRDQFPTQPAEGDTSGPLPVGLLALRTRTDGLSTYSSSVAVFGSASLIDDYFISNVDGENQATYEYMIHLVNFLAAQSADEFETVAPVSLITDRLTFQNDGQITAVFVVTIFVVPACFLACGLLIWRRRKHL